MLFWMLLSCRNDAVDYTAEGLGLGCDPLQPEVCALPWPSTAYMVQDETTGSGWQVALGEDTLPANNAGVPFDPTDLNQRDGFSTWGPLVFWLDDVDPDSLPRPTEPMATDTIQVIDAANGERIPVWAELDDYTDDDERTSIAIRLARPMRHGRRYIVVVKGLKNTAGETIPQPTSFASLLAGDSPRTAYYFRRIIRILEDDGFDRDELQLAWDFVTVSEDSSLAAARHIATDVADWTPSFSVNDVTEFDCDAKDARLWRLIAGTFTVPLYLESAETGARLSQGADGLPIRNGEIVADFRAQVPCSRMQAGTPGPVVQYGHGFFGSRAEMGNNDVLNLQQAAGWTVIGANWRGMSSSDLPVMLGVIGEDLSDFGLLPDQVLQGYAQLDVLLALAQTALGDDPAFQVDGTSLLDPSQIGFYGISQGGVLGLGYLGFSSRLERGALSVPGGPFTTLMPRSFLFLPFFTAFSGAYPDPLERAVVLASLQTVWDRGEGAGWAQTMTDDVLIQTGSGDALVTPFGAYNLARALDAVTIQPPRPIWGVDEGQDGTSGAVITEWLFLDSADEPLEGRPADINTDTHRCVRREETAQLQVRDFIEQGIVNHYCDGPCETVRCTGDD
ncbi:MAG: hypothetical protein AAFV53_14235 [Myxococcota bacterium]